MAVCRGKVSEGFNFADENARGVIVVGIPYPSLETPVLMKKEFNKLKHSQNSSFLDAESWYSLQVRLGLDLLPEYLSIPKAFRAVNQAVGRGRMHSVVLLSYFGSDSTSLRLWS